MWGYHCTWCCSLSSLPGRLESSSWHPEDKRWRYVMSNKKTISPLGIRRVIGHQPNHRVHYFSREIPEKYIKKLPYILASSLIPLKKMDPNLMIPSTCDIVPMRLMTLLTQTFQAIAHEALQVFLPGYPTEHGGKSQKSYDSQEDSETHLRPLGIFQMCPCVGARRKKCSSFQNGTLQITSGMANA